MTKNHLKRIATPKSWPLLRKERKFVTRPNAGGHPLFEGLALGTFMTEIINIANTKKEARNILNEKEVLVGGKRRKDHHFMVGLMDVISIPSIKKHYRILFNKKGKFTAVEIDDKESKMKPTKVTGKNKVNGKLQLNLSSGRNMLVEKDDYKVGDTIVIELPGQNMLEHIKMEKGVAAYLTSGQHIGDVGTIEDIRGEQIIFKSKDKDVFETLKRYAFVLGKAEPVIKLQ